MQADGRVASVRGFVRINGCRFLCMDRRSGTRLCVADFYSLCLCLIKSKTTGALACLFAA